MDQSPRLIEKRHSLIDSSAGSTTEGDSSQKSHKSTVYLHATTGTTNKYITKLHLYIYRKYTFFPDLRTICRNYLKSIQYSNFD